jgi:predicted RNase H-like nuclease (RuvC/YqgF family)
MIKADYVSDRPDIDVKSTGYKIGNIIVATIGEIEISLNERDAKELFEDLDGELNTDTREDLEDRLEKTTDKIYELTDEISELKAYIEQLEGEKE